MGVLYKVGVLVIYVFYRVVVYFWNSNVFLFVWLFVIIDVIVRKWLSSSSIRWDISYLIIKVIGNSGGFFGKISGVIILW